MTEYLVLQALKMRHRERVANAEKLREQVQQLIAYTSKLEAENEALHAAMKAANERRWEQNLAIARLNARVKQLELEAPRES